MCEPEPWGVLEGTLELPRQPRGVVLLAHGAGSDRDSARNRAAADALLRAGVGAFRIDLLTREMRRSERATRHLRFNVGLLAQRVRCATQWLAGHLGTARLRVGYFGAGTGAAAMLQVAAGDGESVAAIVCRSARR